MDEDRTAAQAAANDDQGAPLLRVCFFFNAQRHQLLHGISIAAELARIPGYEVHVSSPSAGHIAYARRLVDALGGAPLHYDVASSRLMALLRRARGTSVPPKIASLGLLARYLDRFDAIAVPERTSMWLRSLGVRKPHFIHLDHGAGDRAAGFDPRIRDFDMVLMAGDKHRERLSRDGLIASGRHAAVGYPKFDAADAIRDRGWRPFANGRPTVLYNPHFGDLGSWRRFGMPLLRALAAQDRYNLIVAPHVRMLDSRAKRARWNAMIAEFAWADHVLIDPGSDRAIDMSYTALADIYIGDVSSQVYEFLRTPKPCLFLDAHGVDWDGDENYAHWRFGPVLRSPDGLIAAIDHACASHHRFAAVQAEGFAQTFGTADGPGSARAAQAIHAYLHSGLGLRHADAVRPPRMTMRRLQRVATIAAAIGCGWLVHDAVGPFTSPAMAKTAFVEGAVKSHHTTLIRARMLSQPEVPLLDTGEIRRATGIVMPRLPATWRLTDVQVYPSSGGLLVQVAATTERGETVSLVAMHIDALTDTNPVLSSRDGENVAYWEDEGDAFAVVGALPSARLLALASDIARMS